MDSLLTTITLTGFTVAFLHAAIPTHWLPFVLVSRARGWRPAKTLSVVFLAGMGHVMLTTLLGLLIAWFGFRVNAELEHVFGPLIGGVMILIGGYFIWRQLSGRGVCHHAAPGSHHEKSEHCGHDHDEQGGGHTATAATSHWEQELRESRLGTDKGDWAAIGGLFLMLTLSPCEVFLPVYLSAVPFGWLGFVLLSAILAVATLAGMILFTWLTLIGFEKLRLRYFEQRESAILGTIFVLLGLVLLLFPYHH
ncbi:hypothetical protein AXK11_03160 [Cephaloticoccus primus]|uniref:Urease accessory protein UreH-like transmembrane domain-containing protein n=1 Tax=Cephaloticoccus primus TaxID=1548207 RepID=A0A139SR18_9BACT|nr:hypothetical protein [Cephaloticoccus primus]KXU36977.1 hypothetical protein AXK11_03160 [Cephaloticoccus primus]